MIGSRCFTSLQKARQFDTGHGHDPLYRYIPVTFPIESGIQLSLVVLSKKVFWHISLVLCPPLVLLFCQGALSAHGSSQCQPSQGQEVARNVSTYRLYTDKDI